jgi:hypothetical protein
MTINASSAGTFTFYDCGLVFRTISDITVGTNLIEDFCISTTSAFGGTAVYTIVSYGSSCTLTTTTTTVAPTTTTTTCNPTPNWVNNGTVFCSACVSYQPQIDNNPCSPTYNTTRNFSLGAGAPCDYTANWVNNGAAFCSACVSYQPQIDNNPCSATYNTTRNFNLGASAPCNYSPNFVNTGTTCVGVDLYNVQTDINPCSPTYNQTQLGSLIEPNSPTCGYTTTTTTQAPVTLTVNGKKSTTGGGTLYVWYSTDGTNYSRLTTAVTNGGLQVGIISGVPYGTNVIFVGAPLSFASTNGTAGSTGTYPTSPASCQSYTLNATSTVTVFITVSSTVTGC